MAFKVPEFPIDCNIYTGPWLTKVFRGNVECNLAFGQRVFYSPQAFANFETAPGSCMMHLLLPPLTDIRSPLVSPSADVIEVPAGTGRWYEAFAVDDIGKGFENEHRVAIILAISVRIDATRFAGCVWPVPIP